MLTRSVKVSLFNFSSGVVLSCFASMQVFAQQVQSNRIPGSFPIDSTASCPSSFKKQIQPGNQHDPNYTGPDKIYLCVPDRPNKLTEKARKNPLSSRSLPFLSLDDFGALETSASQDPVREQLTREEETELSQLINGFNFPDYLLSGCHDRAHAAYLMIPEKLKDKALKIWVVSPSAYTRGVKGTIGLRDNDDINWRYHVALAFQTGKGLRIYDAGLFPNKLVKEQDWFDLAEYPHLSFKTFTPGKAYLFYDEDNDVQALNDQKSYVLNKDIWTGEYYEYTGASLAQNWIPNALARDAVGQRVENSESCSDLMEAKGKPGALLTKLQNQNFDRSKCREDAELFAAKLAEWKDLIGN